jgi:hypothetical protein
MCLGAGYIKTLIDGSTGCSYTAFYEALIDAKGPDKEVEKELAEEDQALWEHIKDRLSLDDAEVEDIFEEIKDLGIDTPDKFDDSYAGCFDSQNAEAQFAEDLYTSIGDIDQDHPLFFAIDWQVVWDSALRYDYSVVDGVFFFNNNF